MKIEGKVAVVTGAASGIGQAVAIELAERGVRPSAWSTAASACSRWPARSTTGWPARGRGHGRRRDRRRPSAPKAFDRCAARYGAAAHLRPRGRHHPRPARRSRSTRRPARPSIYPVENFRLVMEVNLVAPVYWAMEMIARIAEDRGRAGLGPVGAAEEGIQGTVDLHRLGLLAGQPRPGRLRGHQGRPGGRRRHADARRRSTTASGAPSSTPASPTRRWSGPWARSTSRRTSCPTPSSRG